MTSDRRLTGRIHPAAAAVWIAFAVACLALPRVVPDEESLREGLVALGPLGPAAYALAEVVQVLVIPIPGQPFEIAGGWLFGFWPGTVLGSLGAIAGSMLAFVAGRRFGGALLERWVAPDVRRRFTGRLQRGDRALWVVFWLMLIPAFPRDPLCFLAGVTPISVRAFLLVALVSRPAGLAPWVAAGSDGVAMAVRVQIIALVVAGLIWMTYFCLRRFGGFSLSMTGEADA